MMLSLLGTLCALSENQFRSLDFTFFVPGPWESRVAIASEPKFAWQYVVTLYSLNGNKLGVADIPVHLTPSYYFANGSRKDVTSHYDYAGNHVSVEAKDVFYYYESISGPYRIIELDGRLTMLGSDGRFVPVMGNPLRTLVASSYSGGTIASIRFDQSPAMAYVSHGPNKWRQFSVNSRFGPIDPPYNRSMCIDEDDTAYFTSNMTTAIAKNVIAKYGDVETSDSNHTAVYACDLKTGEMTIIADLITDPAPGASMQAIVRRDGLYVTPSSKILLIPWYKGLLQVPVPQKRTKLRGR